MLEKIDITNFLSIKDTQTLKISNKITTIIGENASGKSAILKAIEKLNGKSILEKEKNISMKTEKSEIKAIFKLDKRERIELNKKYKTRHPNSLIKYPEDSNDLSLEITTSDNQKGIYKMYVASSHNEYDLLDENQKNFKTNFNSNIRIIKSEEIKSKLILSSDFDINNLDEKYWDRITPEEKKEIPEALINKIGDIISEIRNKEYNELIPKYEFIYFNSFRDLLVDEIEIQNAHKNTIVSNFLSIANVDLTKIQEAVANSDVQTLRGIEKKTLKITTEEFKKIFSQVSADDAFELSMSIDTASETLNFLVQNQATGTDVLKFSDESEGTQWYLSMYLRLYNYLNKVEPNKKYILLLDEPNVYLNAAAQNDLLNKVFKQNLAEMQIIYTTHSPYMIDAEDLYSLRVIHKDDRTRIFNTNLDYLQYREKTEKRKDVDVLSPVLVATGINVSSQLILNTKDLLVVTEGAQDYYILNAMKKVLKKDEKIKFIPCTGSEKVPFMCGYLVGLGYNVIALVDNDSAGRKAITQMKKQNENGELYGVEYYSIDGKVGDCKLENLFSPSDFSKLIGEKETPNYRNIFDKCKKIKFNDETKANFMYNFSKIEKYLNKN